MRIFKYVVFVVILGFVWRYSFHSILGKDHFIKPLAKEKTIDSFMKSVEQSTDKQQVGNLALGLFKDGKLSHEYYYPQEQNIDRFTMFQMASVSKWVTSWGIHKLVETGKLELDKPVSTYLTRWQLPTSEYDNNKVTIRNILSHTSGFVDGLGYGGFENLEDAQTLEESLTKAADGNPFASETKVGYSPNTDYKYSGGGYTLLQLLIEEVSGMSFQDYMTQAIFKPLGMNRSTFVWSDTLDLNLAKFYNRSGSLAPHYKYTALAAASLYTCVEDLSLFLKANAEENPVVSEATKIAMAKNTVLENGKIINHGMGPMIYGSNDSGDHIIGHNGGNRPAINTSVRFNTKTKEGYIALSTGSRGIAPSLGDEWIHHQTGIVRGGVKWRNLNRFKPILYSGWFVILAGTFFFFRKKSKVAS